MKKYFLMLLLIGQLAAVTKTYGQNIAINGSGSMPDTSAMLDVSSTIKGFLAPRMTTTQQNAIPLPANGLLIYNTTDNAFKVNTGTTGKPVWASLSTASGSSTTTNLLSSSANTMSNTTNGVAATAPIVNSNALLLNGNSLTSTVNGVVSSGLALPFLGSLNGLSGTSQTFSPGTAGSDFGISSSGTNHTFNLPTASATNRGAISAADWSTFNGKQAALVSGTTIKTINGGSILGSGDIALEPIMTAPKTIKNYLNGYKQFVAFLTDSVTEGNLNLYFTSARARAAVSLTTTGTSGVATYNNTTGVLNIPNYTSGGTVTSVGLTSSDITVGGASPITGSGSYTLALPTVNSNVGTYTNATITVNAKGQVTAASSGTSGSPSSSSGWNLTGNSGTGSTSYIGTSDGQPLTFKVNGTQAGYLGLTSSYATSFGLGAAASFKSTAIGGTANANAGNEAVAIGYGSGAAGYRSIAIGSDAQAYATNDAIAIGTGTDANSYQGIAIGATATTTAANSAIAIGVGASASAFQTAAIGSGSRVTGQNSIAIGNGASASGQNSTAIGNGATVSNDNYISIGNTNVSAIRGQVNFTTYSDGRFKRNIHNNVPGLDFILQLRPVTYTWDIHKFNEHARSGDVTVTPASYTAPNDEEEAAIRKKESIVYTGFIAQEVEKAAQTSKFNFSGVLKPLNDKDAYSLSYAEFVVPLVKATQELNEQNEALMNKIDAQQKMIDQLIEDVKDLKKKQK